MIRRYLNWIEIPFIIFLCFSPLFALQHIPQKAPNRSIAQPEAQVRCLAGLCYLKKQESSILEKLSPLDPRKAYYGDVALTLDEQSEMEIQFPDGGKLILKKTSLLTIQKGRGSLAQNIAEEIPGMDDSVSAEEKKNRPKNSIIYLGTLPIEVVYPLPNAEFIAREYPLNIRFAVKKSKSLSGSQSSSENFQKWNLFKDPQGDSQPVSQVEFVEGEDSLLYAEVSLASAGFYILTPQGLNHMEASNSIAFTVLDPTNLEQKVNELIDNLEIEGSSEIEIRQ